MHCVTSMSKANEVNTTPLTDHQDSSENWFAEYFAGFDNGPQAAKAEERQSGLISKERPAKKVEGIGQPAPQPRTDSAPVLSLQEKVDVRDRIIWGKIMPPLSGQLAADIDKARKKIFDFSVQKGKELVDFVNANAKEPLPVIKEALKDHSAFVFLGDQHTYGGKENPMREYSKNAMDVVKNDLVLLVEVPSVLRPVFDKFNQGAAGSEMEIPDHLEIPQSKEAIAALRKTIKDHPDLYKSWKAAHDRGEIVTIPKELSSVLQPVFDKFNKSKPGSEMEIPDYLEPPYSKEALDYLRNRIKDMADEYQTWKVARDHGAIVRPIDNERVLLDKKDPKWEEIMQVCNEHMKEEIFPLMAAYPDRTFAYDTGALHGSKDGKTEVMGSRQLAFLLEQDPRFQITGRHTISFDSIVGDAGAGDERKFHSGSLSSFAMLGSRPFLVPTHTDGKPNIVGQLPHDPRSPKQGSLADGYDYEVVSPTDRGKDAAREKGPIIPDHDATDEDNAYMGRYIPVPEEWQKSLQDLLAQDKPIDEKILALKRLINTQSAADPVREVAHDLQGNSIVLMSFPAFHKRNEFGFDGFPKYFENLSQSVPKGTGLAVLVPSALKSVFDKFNNSPVGTKFEIPEPGSLPDRDANLALDAFNRIHPSVIKLWESAHDHGMTVHPVDNMWLYSGDDKKFETLAKSREEDVKNNILRLATRRPVLGLLEWEMCANSANNSSPTTFDMLKRYANDKRKVTNILCHDHSSLDLALSSFSFDIARPVILQTHSSNGMPKLAGRLPVLQDPTRSNRKETLSSFARAMILSFSDRERRVQP